MSPSGQRDVAAMSQCLHARGMVANHDGNVSVRLPDNKRFLATPTSESKRLVSAGDVITVDAAGKLLAGRRKLFSEWHLHAACYRARSDVRAVLHAHPPAATAFGVVGRAVEPRILSEAVVSLGKRVPLIDYAPPKSPGQDLAIAASLEDADVMILAGNGVLAVGTTLEQAYLRLELVEHLARILTYAAALGAPSLLPDSDVEKLLAARTQAGLGRAGRRAG